MNVPLCSPSAYLDMQLKKIERNKAIPSRAREPAALSIYAPLKKNISEVIWGHKSNNKVKF